MFREEKLSPLHLEDNPVSRGGLPETGPRSRCSRLSGVAYRLSKRGLKAGDDMKWLREGRRRTRGG